MFCLIWAFLASIKPQKGVTPFASLLRSVYYKKKLGLPMKLSKIYFIWICPEMKAFEWFTGLLKVFSSSPQIFLKNTKQLNLLKNSEKWRTASRNRRNKSNRSSSLSLTRLGRCDCAENNDERNVGRAEGCFVWSCYRIEGAYSLWVRFSWFIN